MIPKVEFSLKKLKNNICFLLQKCKNVDFLFPVKCCTNNKVLELIAELGLGFDVSNINEYKMIKKHNDGRIISSSGPLSYELYTISGVLVAANSLERWNGEAGLRVNFNSDDRFELSHFGVDYTEIDEDILRRISYVHFHNSDYRNEDKCKYIIDNIKRILHYFPNLKTLNIGGHIENLGFNEGIDYINEVRTIVPDNINLIVEAGDFLFKNVGKLICEVVDRYMNQNSQIVILNFSKIANQRWAYPILIENNVLKTSASKLHTYFFGCSCCEKDIYLQTDSHRQYIIGEKIEFSNISPYSYQWNNEFNGIEDFEYCFVDE